MNKFLTTAVLFLSVHLSGCASRTLSTNQICHGSRCITVEVVQKEEDLQKGLQGRTFLPNDHGMLFVFAENGRHVFWMKETVIPLDMIWLDYAKRIVHIEENVAPCTDAACPLYGPPPEVQSWYVLEINAGQSRVWGIKSGDVLEFRLNSF